MTIVIPDICNRVRVHTAYMGIASPAVIFVLMHNTAPLERAQVLEGKNEVDELRALLLTDEWTRTQPYPNDPILSQMSEFVRKPNDKPTRDGLAESDSRD